MKKNILRAMIIACAFTLTGVITLAATEAQAACTINNNAGDDYVIICNSASPNPGGRRRRLNVHTSNTVIGGVTAISHTGGNNVIAGEDIESGGNVIPGQASTSVQFIQRVGNIKLNFNFGGGIFPE